MDTHMKTLIRRGAQAILAVMKKTWEDTMKNTSAILDMAGLALMLASSVSWAYGGGGSSAASCSEPRFSEESPARNAIVTQLSEVDIVASENTDLQSLEFEIGPNKVKPEVVTRRTGEYELRAKLASPWQQPGKLRIALSAKSKDGCSGLFPYFIEVKP